MNELVLAESLEKPCTSVQFQRVLSSGVDRSVETTPVKRVMEKQQVPSPEVQRPFTPRLQPHYSPERDLVPEVQQQFSPVQQQQQPFTPVQQQQSFTPTMQPQLSPTIQQPLSPAMQNASSPQLSDGDRKRTLSPSHSTPQSPTAIPRNSEGVESCVREVVQPMIDDLKVFIHNEILNIKETMVNQITMQETIINKQQQCIELLEQLLRERQ